MAKKRIRDLVKQRIASRKHYQANREREIARSKRYAHPSRNAAAASPEVSDAELDRRALEALRKEGHRASA